MSTTRFRTVQGPSGRLVHFDYLNDGRTDDAARSTSCGRKVPTTWTVQAVDAASIVQAVTCPGCQQWAQYHVDREQVDAALTARLGEGWKDQPHRYLPAVDLQAAQQLLARLQGQDAQQPAITTREELVARLEPAMGRERAEQVATARDALQTELEQLGDAPSCTSASYGDRGRHAVLRNVAQQGRARMTAATPPVPASGTPSLC